MFELSRNKVKHVRTLKRPIELNSSFNTKDSNEKTHTSGTETSDDMLPWAAKKHSHPRLIKFECWKRRFAPNLNFNRHKKGKKRQDEKFTTVSRTSAGNAIFPLHKVRFWRNRSSQARKSNCAFLNLKTFQNAIKKLMLTTKNV